MEKLFARLCLASALTVVMTTAAGRAAAQEVPGPSVSGTVITSAPTRYGPGMIGVVAFTDPATGEAWGHVLLGHQRFEIISVYVRDNYAVIHFYLGDPNIPPDEWLVIEDNGVPVGGQPMDRFFLMQTDQNPSGEEVLEYALSDPDYYLSTVWAGDFTVRDVTP